MFKIIQPIFSILIGGLIIFFFVRPMYAEIGTIQFEGQKYREAVEDAKEFNRLLDTLLSRYENLTQSQRARLDALVPQDGINEVKLVSDLEELAFSHGLLFTSVNVGLSKTEEGGEGAIPEEEVVVEEAVVNDGMSVEGGESFGEAEAAANASQDSLRAKEIGFTVVGTYEEFRDFLADVERSLVLMEVTKLTFAAAEEGDLMTFSVSVNVFSLPEK